MYLLYSINLFSSYGLRDISFQELFLFLYLSAFQKAERCSTAEKEDQ